MALSAFTHLWNPIGFPSIHADEGTYMLHALTFLKDKTLLPQGAPFYDHPYLGRIFLASIFGIIGYPDTLNPRDDGSTRSVEMLYLVPRALMGLLAVADTFLVYKIGEHRYSRNIAFIAAILFAVMPITWILRRIFLDNLLLPFMLSSILFAIYRKNGSKENFTSFGHSTNSKTNYRNNRKEKNKTHVAQVIFSGILLGTAIFTKIPAFTFIPLIGFLVFTNNNRDWKLVGLWLVPVVLIPAIWPALAYSVGQLENWFDAVKHQATERQDKPLVNSIMTFFEIDPVLLIIGFAGIVYTALKKDLFILLSVIPYLVFLQLVGFVSVYHLIVLVPAICIASAVMINELSGRMRSDKIRRVLPFAIISAIGIFGLLIVFIIINNDFNSSYFKTYAAVIQNLPNSYNDENHNDGNAGDSLSILIGRYWTKSFIWVADYVFNKEYVFVRDNLRCCSDPSPDVLLDQINNNLITPTPKVILIADNSMKREIKDSTSEEKSDIFRKIYSLTHLAMLVDEERFPHNREIYPYSALYDNRGIGDIEIRVND